MMRFVEREKRLIANLIGATIAGLAILYSIEVSKNSRGYIPIAEQTQEGHIFRLYATCSPSRAQLPPLQRDQRYVAGAADGKGILAETNYLEGPMGIDRKRGGIHDLLDHLGYSVFEANFADRFRLSAGQLCLPKNPFRG